MVLLKKFVSLHVSLIFTLFRVDKRLRVIVVMYGWSFVVLEMCFIIARRTMTWAVVTWACGNADWACSPLGGSNLPCCGCLGVYNKSTACIITGCIASGPHVFKPWQGSRQRYVNGQMVVSSVAVKGVRMQQ